MEMEIHNVPLFFLVALSPVILVVVLIVINSMRNKKREKKEEQTYKAENVKDLTLTDTEFGEITGSFDRLTGILLAENVKLPPFGRTAPSQIMVEDYTEQKDRDIFRALSLAYRKKEEILQKLAESIQDEMRENGREDLPDIEKIRQQIDVTDFDLAYSDDLLTMQILAGATIDVDTFSLIVFYWSDTEQWEYDATLNEGGV